MTGGCHSCQICMCIISLEGHIHTQSNPESFRFIRSRVSLRNCFFFFLALVTQCPDYSTGLGTALGKPLLWSQSMAMHTRREAVIRKMCGISVETLGPVIITLLLLQVSLGSLYQYFLDGIYAFLGNPMPWSDSQWENEMAYQNHFSCFKPHIHQPPTSSKVLRVSPEDAFST